MALFCCFTLPRLIADSGCSSLQMNPTCSLYRNIPDSCRTLVPVPLPRIPAPLGRRLHRQLSPSYNLQIETVYVVSSSNAFCLILRFSEALPPFRMEAFGGGGLTGLEGDRKTGQDVRTANGTLPSLRCPAWPAPPDSPPPRLEGVCMSTVQFFSLLALWLSPAGRQKHPPPPIAWRDIEARSAPMARVAPLRCRPRDGARVGDCWVRDLSSPLCRAAPARESTGGSRPPTSAY